MTVEIRAARPDDGSAMRALVQSAYRHYVPELGVTPAPMTADYEAIAASGRAWVAVLRETVVGVVVVEPHTDHLLIENVAVAPDQQRQGTGALLLRTAEDYARELGLQETRLYTHVGMTDNRAYYARHGYQELHEAVEDSFHRVHFRKLLRCARVVGSGAICDLGTSPTDDESSQSFRVSEYVQLSDGEQVILHRERGYTVAWHFGPIQDALTADDVIHDVRNVVLPDDDEAEEDHPWSWLAELARARGVDVSAEQLRELPYQVILTEQVRAWLAGSAR